MAEHGPTYTNALQLKAKFQVLKTRQDLKFAALDCWKAVAELLPDGVTLEGYNFNDGRKLTLSGSAPADQTKRLLDFDADIRKAAVNGQPLFDPNAGEHVTWDVRGQCGELALRPRTQTGGGAMTGYLDRLNLRPFEKRLVVGVGAVLFVVLNAWFVFPHFSDLSQARDRRAEALKKLDRWQAEIDQAPKYQAGINGFVKEGQEVPAEDQREPVRPRHPESAGQERRRHRQLWENRH